MEAAAFARQWLKNVEIETSEEMKIKRIWLEHQYVGVLVRIHMYLHFFAEVLPM